MEQPVCPARVAMMFENDTPRIEPNGRTSHPRTALTPALTKPTWREDCRAYARLARALADVDTMPGWTGTAGPFPKDDRSPAGAGRKIR